MNGIRQVSATRRLIVPNSFQAITKNASVTLAFLGSKCDT
jgi:hypothetical protein